MKDCLRKLVRINRNLAKTKIPFSAAQNSKAHRRYHGYPNFSAPRALLSAFTSGIRNATSTSVAAHGTPLPRHPKIKEITNSTRNRKNRSFAMPADAAAIPPNPKSAATSAMIRNTTAQPNISSPPHRLNRICRLPRVPPASASSRPDSWST